MPAWLSWLSLAGLAPPSGCPSPTCSLVFLSLLCDGGEHKRERKMRGQVGEGQPEGGASPASYDQTIKQAFFYPDVTVLIYLPRVPKDPGVYFAVL